MRILALDTPDGPMSLFMAEPAGTPRGAIFIPFAYYEAAANLMTNAALDPVGKIPEFKYCAVAIRRGGSTRENAGFGVNDAALTR